MIVMLMESQRRSRKKRGIRMKQIICDRSAKFWSAERCAPIGPGRAQSQSLACKRATTSGEVGGKVGKIECGVIPLLTTKKVFWKGIVEEILWFIRGQTNAKTLSERGVKIWDANGSRAFLDSMGFTDREEGDLGPVYGFQWRHFGAEYRGTDADYAGEGVDQLTELIERIRTEPFSRRHILCAWNVADIPKMALPPCHTLCQFYVSTDQELSCQLYQRSGDMGLGVPFNIASYSLLTHMVAHVTGLKTGEFVHTLGDAHIYLNHVDALKEQMSRTPKPFPRVVFNNRPDGKPITNIDEFTPDSVLLEGYDPMPPIKMQMAL